MNPRSLKKSPFPVWRAGLACAAASCLALVPFASRTGQAADRMRVATDTPERRECPITDSVFSIVAGKEGRQTVVLTRVALAGPISKVPEFHDCQRFVVDHHYDSLYAVFAAFDLVRRGLVYTDSALADSVRARTDSANADSARYYIERRRALRSRRGQSPSEFAPKARALHRTGSSRQAEYALAFAEILSWEGTYDALGILPGFNCLVMFAVDGHWRARMVPVEYERICLQRFSVSDIGTLGTELEVHALPLAVGGIAFQPSDIPPVARWDWDPRNNQHYIGLRCGLQWCEVGAGGFQSAADLADHPDFDPVPTIVAAGLAPHTATSSETDRVSRVRGWYDTQRLAVVAGRDAAGNPLVVPGHTWGYLVPNPLLWRLNDTAFDGHWIHAVTAIVDSDYDGRKVRLRRGENKIYLCHGTAGECTVRGVVPTCKNPPGEWWSAVDAPGLPEVFKCVERTDHAHEAMVDHFRIPGTARWRWLALDETTWKRCMEGCCEIQ